jgi:hypothetical protein
MNILMTSFTIIIGTIARQMPDSRELKWAPSLRPAGAAGRPSAAAHGRLLCAVVPCARSTGGARPAGDGARASVGQRAASRRASLPAREGGSSGLGTRGRSSWRLRTGNGRGERERTPRGSDIRRTAHPAASRARQHSTRAPWLSPSAGRGRCWRVRVSCSSHASVLTLQRWRTITTVVTHTRAMAPSANTVSPGTRIQRRKASRGVTL